MNWSKLRAFAKAAAIRAAHTFFQAFVGAIGVGVALEEVNWSRVLSTATVAAIISLCKSIIVGLPEVDRK